jgi:predicted CoA-binding protein
MTDVQDYEDLLKMQVIAMVGCSTKPERASNRVASYLMDAGYKIIPVNPHYAEVLGETCFPDLLSVSEPIECVNVFRRAEFVPAVVDEALKIGAKGLWLQDGIDAPEAVAKARAAGMKVVVNDCLMRQHVSRCGR